MKGISVITDFGCPFDCPYCIWKGHPLRGSRKPTDWRKLGAFLLEGSARGCGHVSVSGGGEPLNEFYKHGEWWIKMASLCKARGLRLDVHTRLRPDWGFIDREVGKLVLSSDRVEDVEKYALEEHPFQVRVVHVVTASDDMRVLMDYASAFLGTRVQLSFKKLHGGDDNGLWEDARKMIPGPSYIEDRDYNRYFMPDNSIRDRFL